jgi:hypothetical protein
MSEATTYSVVSLRSIRNVPWYCGLVQAEDVLVDCLGARLHTVEVAGARWERGPAASMHVRRAISLTHLARPYVIRPAERDVAPTDVVVVFANDLHDAGVLLNVEGWERLGKKVIVYLVEITGTDLRRYPDVIAHLSRRADGLFTGSEGPSLERFRPAGGRVQTTGVVEPMLDVLAFPDRPDPAQRPVDVVNVGRRSPSQHALLSEWAAAHDGYYVRDQSYLPTVTSLADHRQMFAATLTRSRLFIANYARFNQPSQQNDAPEVGTRFYEGMAGGCIIAGELPVRSQRFQERFASLGWLEFPVESASLPPAVCEALDEPASHAAIGRRARSEALRAHDVAHRWREICKVAELPIAAGVEARVERLAQLADAAQGRTNEQPPDDGHAPTMGRTAH